MFTITQNSDAARHLQAITNLMPRTGSLIADDITILIKFVHFVLLLQRIVKQCQDIFFALPISLIYSQEQFSREILDPDLFRVWSSSHLLYCGIRKQEHLVCNKHERCLYLLSLRMMSHPSPLVKFSVKSIPTSPKSASSSRCCID
jgi:hypothetical protein